MSANHKDKFILVGKFGESLDDNHLIFMIYQPTNNKNCNLVDRHAQFPPVCSTVNLHIAESSTIKTDTAYQKHILAMRGFHIAIILMVDCDYRITKPRSKALQSVIQPVG